MNHTHIKLEHISLTYGEGAVALSDVSLSVRAGERVCILGANGSGKSTLASVIAGLLAPDAGTVELLGEKVCANEAPNYEAYRRARRGLGLVFQSPDDQIVTSVVEEDVAFGPENLGLPSEEIARRVARELQRVALTDYAHANPSRLSGGQRQRVTIAGALAMEPQVLVLDEPASLLDVRGREAILRVMGRLAAAGHTLIHITHFMDEALQADRIVVLDHGRIALEGTPADVFSHGRELLQSLGLDMPFAARLAHRAQQAGLELPWTCNSDEMAQQVARLVPAQERHAAPAITTPTTSAHTPEVLLSVKNASFSYGGAQGAHVIRDVSLTIAAGTSTAIVGQTGSGKSTLLRLLCGLERPESGSVVVCGIDTSTRRGRRHAKRSVGYVMQHPERQLFAETVLADVAFGPRNLGMSSSKAEAIAREALELVGLVGREDANPFSLSGGQKRLCALAGVLAMGPQVLVLDEPVAGLDPRGRLMLRQTLARLLDEGVTLVQVTHSMEDAARADQVVVLDAGTVLGTGAPRDVFCGPLSEQLAGAGLGLPAPLAFAHKAEKLGACPLGNPLTSADLISALQERLARSEVMPS